MSMRGSRSIRSFAALAAATAAAFMSGSPASAAAGRASGVGHQLEQRPAAVQRTAPISPLATTAADEVERIAGTNRITTAIEVSQYGWGDAGSAAEANGVLLARSDLFPDALAGVPLAATVGGPLLLTPPTALDFGTKAEMQRVLARGKTVYLLGGAGALSESVATAVTGAGYNVMRLAGGDRAGTAAAIADEIAKQEGVGTPDVPGVAILATGLNFPDALAAGPAAGLSSGGVVLLTNDGTMPAATRSFLDAHPSMAVYTVGGPAKAAYPSVKNISGLDRSATAVEVATFFWNDKGIAPAEFGLATGSNFPDALSGGALCAVFGAPMLLTGRTSLAAPTQAYLADNKASIIRGFVFGGTGVVSDTALTQAAAAIT